MGFSISYYYYSILLKNRKIVVIKPDPCKVIKIVSDNTNTNLYNQNSSIIYEYIGGKNLLNRKKNRIKIEDRHEKPIKIDAREIIFNQEYDIAINNIDYQVNVRYIDTKLQNIENKQVHTLGSEVRSDDTDSSINPFSVLTKNIKNHLTILDIDSDTLKLNISKRKKIKTYSLEILSDINKEELERYGQDMFKKYPEILDGTKYEIQKRYVDNELLYILSIGMYKDYSIAYNTCKKLRSNNEECLVMIN